MSAPRLILIEGMIGAGKLMLTDPQHDWPAALTRIGAAIRP